LGNHQRPRGNNTIYIERQTETRKKKYFRKGSVNRIDSDGREELDQQGWRGEGKQGEE
jgi:hypothetical protein